jgi:hypothetical protein
LAWTFSQRRSSGTKSAAQAAVRVRIDNVRARRLYASPVVIAAALPLIGLVSLLLRKHLDPCSHSWRRVDFWGCTRSGRRAFSSRVIFPDFKSRYP